jgi:hypothetical protein
MQTQFKTTSPTRAAPADPEAITADWSHAKAIDDKNSATNDNPPPQTNAVADDPKTLNDNAPPTATDDTPRATNGNALPNANDHDPPMPQNGDAPPVAIDDWTDESRTI